jgi:GNAT superfamily N-acetyltransferase
VTFSQAAFRGAAYPHYGLRVDTNPAARAFVIQNCATTPEDIGEIFLDQLPRGSDVALRLLECRERLEIRLACPDETNRRNIAEAMCIFNAQDTSFKFCTIKTAPEFRGNGLGRRIIGNSLDVADDLGASSYQMTAGLSHGPAFWAAMKFRPNGDQFNFTFKDPLKERVRALEPYVDAITHQAVCRTMAMPYTILPEELLLQRSDMRFMAEPGFKPSGEILWAFRALLPENAPKQAKAHFFVEKINGLKRPEGSLRLCDMMMSGLSYEAELYLDDRDAVRRVRDSLASHKSRTSPDSFSSARTPSQEM